MSEDADTLRTLLVSHSEWKDKYYEAIARAEKAEAERDEARNDCETAETMYAEERQRTKHALALIARAAEAIEPFNALTPSDADRPDYAVARIPPVYLSDLRRLAAIAADLRKAGEGA